MSEGPPTSGSGGAPGAQPAQPEVPAGWYPHPTAPGWEAYWTGSGWGAETRQAQAPAPAPAVPAAAAEPQAQTGVQPDAGTAAAVAGAGQAAQAQPAHQAVTQTPAQEASAQGVPDRTAATTAATPVPAVVSPATSRERSNSALPVILCVLGAIVAIVGSFLPMASSSFDGIDFADNTMVGQSIGLAVIAVAVIGAALAIWSYLKGNRTWLVVLAGLVVVAIAAYMGLAGIDDLSPEIPAAAGGGDVKISGDLSDAINPDSSPSTGIFAVAVGGLLMALGGVGLARENR
jgi:hypothetical protein